MSVIITLLSPIAYLEVPQSVAEWVGLIILIGLILYSLWKWKGYNKPFDSKRWWVLIVLGLFVPLTSLFFGIYFPLGTSLTPPGVPVEPEGPVAMIFSAIPWMLAGGLLGPASAVGLALFSGLLQALWNTHSPFTPLEMALMATLFGALVNQRYRTLLYQLGRHPVLAAIAITLLHPILMLSITPLSARGLLVSRLDYAIAFVGVSTLALAIEFLAGGLSSEVVATGLPDEWGGEGPLTTPPWEKSLQNRFLYSLTPLAILLTLALMIGAWFFAGRAARNLLLTVMGNTAEVAAENVPAFLESGHIQITRITSSMETRSISDPEELNSILAETIKTEPFFDQLLIFDQNQNLVGAYPSENYTGMHMPIEEKYGIKTALAGFPVQIFTIAPKYDETAAQISYVSPIYDEFGNILAVLVGRTDISNNPQSQSIITILNNMGKVNGQGLLLDENGNIVIHPNSGLILEEYPGITTDEPAFFDGTAPDGTRSLVYYQPIDGSAWSVVTMVPASQAQQLSLAIATPLLIMIICISILAIIIIRMSLRPVITSLQNLAQAANRLSRGGNLNQPMLVEGEDEIGQLRHDFEQMRISLKGRLDELNRLLTVSQGVASGLDVEDAVQPILEAALMTGANCARTVMTPEVVPELGQDQSTPISFGMGPSMYMYKGLDEEILDYARNHERLILSNITHQHLFDISSDTVKPASLIAIALNHENMYYGVLWTAYDNPHTFTEEEVRYVSTLAGYAALAAANTRLFLSAEVERQRLAAILASSPDPILVTDQNDHLLFANPAAWQILGIGADLDSSNTLADIIPQVELVDLLQDSEAGRQTIEITLPDEQTYMATATPVMAEGQRVGRVSVLRDVTRLSELNTLKSEFVSSVSHTLRAPLVLIHGYASMIEMVGQLNEQQVGYLKQIVENVDTMSHRVSNLLDLGRIEAGIGLQLEMIPLREIIDEVVNALKIQATQKRIQFDSEILEHTVPLIEADRSLLQQALYNLVDNAIKFTPNEGKVDIKVSSHQDNMIFTIIDTGVGISPMDQARLFEKFQPGKSPGIGESRGSGLGLAIVKSISDRHGGKVWVESQLGKGSTFYLSIPLRQAVVNEPHS